MASELDPTVLLRHAGWTRALARRLAADASLADDLVQEAWVAALERPPDRGRPVRGWIASVLRRRWLDLRRGRARVAARERAAASDGAWPSAHDVVEKAALQRALVGAVLELAEPYRTTVPLRFFEELPQREIARRMGTTSATVNSRLTRGLARLRERLERNRGGADWLRVLVPLLKEPAGVPAVVLGAGAMKTLSIVLVVVASAVAGLFYWTGEPGDGARVAASAPSAPAEPELAAEDVPPRAGTREPPPARRAELESRPSDFAPAEPSPAEPVPATARIVRGRVIDAAGAGVAGIVLRLDSSASSARATSGPGGGFELALDAQAKAIVAVDREYVTVLAGSIGVRAETRPIVVVAPRIHLGGRAVDEARLPLANVALELRLPQGFGAELGVPLDHSIPQRWQARSDESGCFALADVPAVEGALVRAAVAGFAPAAVEAPLRSTDALELVLARPGPATGLVAGVVLDPQGARVGDARVSAGAEIALTDADGAFTLDLPPEAARLVALRAGWLPTSFEPTVDADGRALWPSHVVLQLAGTALDSPALVGRVVDAAGAPMAGVNVWLDDPTPFGRTADARLAVESLLAADERFWSHAVTAADGTFSIAGVLSRAYRLQAVDPRTLASIESPPVTAAQSPVELRLPTDDLLPRVAGRVVTAAGRPIAGVRVRTFRVTYEVEHDGGTDNECMESASVVTGADGGFELRDVPRDVEVLVTGDTILGASARLSDGADGADPEDLEIVATLRLHVQLVLDEPFDRADRLRVVDAQGRRVFLSVFHGSGAAASFDLPLHEGRSDVFAVGEQADTLVLERAGAEVARIPLHLVPGETNVVRY